MTEFQILAVTGVLGLGIVWLSVYLALKKLIPPNASP